MKKFILLFCLIAFACCGVNQKQLTFEECISKYRILQEPNDYGGYFYYIQERKKENWKYVKEYDVIVTKLYYGTYEEAKNAIEKHCREI